MTAKPQSESLAKGRFPDFVIAGATRSGTTSLYHYLRAHPEIFLPAEKELNFFNHDANFQQGLPAYRQHFREVDGASVAGDASPMYWTRGMSRNQQGQYQFNLLDDAGTRLASVLPQLKTIISLRDPVRRAYSQFWRNHTRQQDTAQSFAEALQEEQQGQRPAEETRLCWIYHNMYSIHLQRWLELFPRSQIKVLVFEDWVRHPRAMLREVFQFLGVDPEFCPEQLIPHNTGWETRNLLWREYMTPWLSRIPGLRRLDQWNRKDGYPDLDRDTYLHAQQIFADDVQQLEQLLGRNLDVWREWKPKLQ